jgi:hypothetical protein
MNDERLKPPFLAFIFSKQKPGPRSDQMALGGHDNSLCESCMASSALPEHLFPSQVTMGCDHALIPKELSAVCEHKELILAS